jgi:hypothetical protein
MRKFLPLIVLLLPFTALADGVAPIEPLEVVEEVEDGWSTVAETGSDFVASVLVYQGLDTSWWTPIPTVGEHSTSVYLSSPATELRMQFVTPMCVRSLL